MRKEMAYYLKPLQGAVRMGKFKWMFSERLTNKDGLFHDYYNVNNRSTHPQNLTFQDQKYQLLLNLNLMVRVKVDKESFVS